MQHEANSSSLQIEENTIKKEGVHRFHQSTLKIIQYNLEDQEEMGPCYPAAFSQVVGRDQKKIYENFQKHLEHNMFV